MSKPRILIVDDDQNLSALVCLILEKTNRFEVRVQNRSAQALACARQFRPDLVLLDVDMPGKDGGAVAGEIGADPTLQDVPILFLTSLISSTEAGENMVMRGGKHFLAKPVSAKALLAATNRMLSMEEKTA